MKNLVAMSMEVTFQVSSTIKKDSIGNYQLDKKHDFICYLAYDYFTQV